MANYICIYAYVYMNYYTIAQIKFSEKDHPGKCDTDPSANLITFVNEVQYRRLILCGSY